MALLLSALTFLAVAVIGVAGWLFFTFDSTQDVVRQRIEAVRKAEQHGEISVDLQLLRNEMYSSVPLVHRILMRLTWSRWLNDFIAQAGMKTKLGKILLLSAVCSLGGYVVTIRLTREPAGGRRGRVAARVRSHRSGGFQAP